MTTLPLLRRLLSRRRRPKPPPGIREGDRVRFLDPRDISGVGQHFHGKTGVYVGFDPAEDRSCRLVYKVHLDEHDDEPDMCLGPGIPF